MNISIIYTKEDNEVMLQVFQRLNSLDDDLNISIWHDNPIYTGQLWKPKNESRLNETDIFLLLVSDTFMHSEFIKQLEFKLVIDRYKEEKAKVIPVIIDNCQWDIEFKSDDYDFKLSELEVLPAEGKPIGVWESTDLGYKSVIASLEKLINPLAENSIPEESQIDEEKKVEDPTEDEQLAINFSQEAEAKKKAEEEKKLVEAARAKREAEKEKRAREEIAAARMAEEKRRAKEAANTQKKGEELRLKQIAEDKLKAEKELKEKAAETARKAEEERRQKIETEPKRMAEEENQPKLAAEDIRKMDETQKEKAGSLKKLIVVALSIVLLVVLGIWAISKITDSENQTTPIPAIEAEGAKVAVPAAETKTDSTQKDAELSKLAIGDIFEGGIIFSIDGAGKNGKMAHLDDSGPMTWNSAMQVHEVMGEGWRLPTFDELHKMYRTIGQGGSNKGEFANGLYWSATDYDAHQARLLRFSDGNTSYHYNKVLDHRKYLFRPIREFSR